ncbi:MAG: UDP-N-acetylmuramoyl-L-alanine--D-glutamate ligase [Bacteroidales bacterium]|nr:UDP-N-acetylmuramoyl-L-alanine--D-glutamate ligase [Bacteroidales bacterium]
MIKGITEAMKGKKLLIAGFGKEGRSSLRFVRENLPQADVTIADHNAMLQTEITENFPDVSFLGGPKCLNKLDEFDLVLKSPGMKLPDKIDKTVQISSQTDLFLAAFHKQIIGITGTKGKSTTSHLIYHLLREAGRKAVLVGNMGTPCFDSIPDLKPDTLIVFELSAHQLQYVRHSPHVALLLNVFEEHLDYFGNLTAYRNAKLNILRYAATSDYALADIRLKAFVSDTGAWVHFVDPDLPSDDQPLPISLPGSHNQFNAAMAMYAVEKFGVSREESLHSLAGFEGLPHRLQLVGPYDGVRYVNDSIATVPEATIAALQAWPQTNYLILGGFDRGINYKQLIEYLIDSPPEMIFFTGVAGKRIVEGLQERNYSATMHPFEELEEVFDYLKLHAEAGQVCLLSPAAASYDKYQNFEQRGEKFLELAKGIMAR